MNYIPEIDEDEGFCPRCGSTDTISITSKTKRACLKCEFSEEFESHRHVLLGWQKRVNLPINAMANRSVFEVEDPQIVPKTAAVERVPEAVEKMVEAVDPRVTRITIPTIYRESFNKFLSVQNVEQTHPCKTDVWNNIESAYTTFELQASYPTADQLFDLWSTTLN